MNVCFGQPGTLRDVIHRRAFIAVASEFLFGRRNDQLLVFLTNSPGDLAAAVRIDTKQHGDDWGSDYLGMEPATPSTNQLNAINSSIVIALPVATLVAPVLSLSG